MEQRDTIADTGATITTNYRTLRTLTLSTGIDGQARHRFQNVPIMGNQ